MPLSGKESIMAVFAKPEISASIKVSNKAVADIVKVAAAKTATTTTVEAYAENQLATWQKIHGVLTQSGEFKGQRFSGAKDHTPEANLAVLRDAVLSGIMPKLTK
jgi:hypothetical protein